MARKKITMVALVSAWAVLGWLWWQDDDAPKEARAKSQIQRVSALRLIAAYEENPVLAEAMFKGTWDVEGEVTGIGKEILGRPYVILNNGVQCVFTIQGTRVAAMRKGSEISTRCNANGKLGYIQMHECH